MSRARYGPLLRMALEMEADEADPAARPGQQQQGQQIQQIGQVQQQGQEMQQDIQGEEGGAAAARPADPADRPGAAARPGDAAGHSRGGGLALGREDTARGEDPPHGQSPAGPNETGGKAHPPKAKDPARGEDAQSSFGRLASARGGGRKSPSDSGSAAAECPTGTAAPTPHNLFHSEQLRECAMAAAQAQEKAQQEQHCQLQNDPAFKEMATTGG